MTHTVTLKTAKRMKELGFSQETDCWWSKLKNDKWHVYTKWQIGNHPELFKDTLSAPISDEILEVLPETIVVSNKIYVLWVNKVDGVWRCGYEEEPNSCLFFQENNKSLPEALGQMFNYLKEKELI